MNSLNLLRPAVKTIAMMMVVASMIFMASCKDDDNDTTTFPAPTVTATPAAVADLPGAKVTTSVVVNSPGGGKMLNILLNGSATGAPASVTLDGTTAQTVSVDFTIPTAAAIGQVYTLSFQSTDKNDQASQAAYFAVTVSATPSKPTVTVSADITADTHWTAGNVYILTKLINVGTDTKDTPGNGQAPTVKTTATLTIDAGTVILGQRGTPGGGLIVHRGSKIVAVGTSSAPIVMTSAQVPGTRVAGDWAGLVICGKATNNVKASISTGQDGLEELEGAYGGYHGGSDDTDNSGTYQFLRVEFAGYPINPNQEINGITFGSVGSGTTFDHVQVSYSNDDSFEWFGGAIQAKNLVAYKGLDDDFDTDNGFHGQVQFGIALRDQNIADQSGSNGFECDNDANGTANTPLTNATFSNMTIIGGKKAQNTTINLQFQNIAQIRRNAEEDVINSFFTAFPNGIFIDNALGTPGTSARVASGDLVIKNNVIAGVDGWGGNGFGSAANADEQAVLGVAAGVNHPNNPRGMLSFSGAGGFTNGVFTPSGSEVQINSMSAVNYFFAGATPLNKAYAAWTNADIKLNANIFDPITATPTLTVGAGSVLLTGASFTGYTGFQTVAYKGAFDGTTDWTTGWVNWNPQITDYTK